MSEAEQRRQVGVEAMQVGDVDDVGVRSKRLSRVGSDKRELQSARSDVETKHSKEDLVWKNVNHQVTRPVVAAWYKKDIPRSRLLNSFIAWLRVQCSVINELSKEPTN